VKNSFRFIVSVVLLALAATAISAAQNQSFKVLHNFTGTDGDNSYASPIADRAGNIYGTTNAGGAFGYGTVFRLDASGSYSVLHSFNGTSDGGGPFASLVLDQAGNLYGTASGTVDGLPTVVGTVFKLDTSGNNFTVLHTFGPSDGFTPDGGLVMDGVNNLYGTTFATVFKLDIFGNNFTVLHTFTLADGGVGPWGPLVLDGAGNLYGTTSEIEVQGFDGQANWFYGSVFKLDSFGGNFQVLHTFTNSPDGADPRSGLVFDSAGYLYGTTSSGGASGMGTVYRIDIYGRNYSIIHNFSGPDGCGPEGERGVVFDRVGSLYGTTTWCGGGEGTVFRMDAAGNNYSLLHTFSDPDGADIHSGLALDKAGNIYGTARAGGANGHGTIFEIPRLSDLAVIKSGPFARAYGEVAFYTLQVANSGPYPSTHVVVTDPLPPGTTFLAATPSQGTCTNPQIGTTGTVTCNLGSLANGASATVIITVQVTAFAGLIIKNTATVSSADTFDPNTTNNSSSFFTTVTKAPALVLLTNLTQTYNGNPKSVTVTTLPLGLAVNVTYNGSTTLPVNAGTYAVVATVVDPNYQGSATGTLTINKATARLQLSNLLQTYNGTPKTVKVTTIPAGLSGVTVTYNGSTTPPINAGSYPVLAILQNPNYTANKVGDTMVISKLNAVVNANAAGKSYGSADPALGATESGFVPADAAVIYLFATRAPGENVGVYPITPFASGMPLSNYNVTYNSASFTISPATPVFRGLSASQSVAVGTGSINLAGMISAGAGYPTPGEPVSITINGASMVATIASNGQFSTTFNTSTIPVSSSPYPITYSYAGDSNMGSASNSSTTLTVTSACVQMGLTGLGDFSCTGNLNDGRFWHTSTILNDGTVLVAGGLSRYGDPTSALNTAELYDRTGHFLRTAGNMNYPHAYHTATLLDSGMVLIAAGLDSSGRTTANTELYDPITGTFTPTRDATGNLTLLNQTRDQHTATVLHCTCPDDGKVLIVGGYNSALGPLTSAELYNPADGTFSSISNTGGSPNLNTARYGHTATLLNNGLVLFAGGFNFTTGELNSAELYDPWGQLFVYTTHVRACPAPPCSPIVTTLNLPRFEHTATLLNDGRVLLAGGVENFGSTPVTTNSAEIYDPASQFFTLTQDANGNTSTLNTARYLHSATLLNNGTVLIAGGQVDSNGTPTSATELYDPASGLFGVASDVSGNLATLNTARDVQTATLLNNGNVLLAGGVFSTTISAGSGTLLATASSELYQPVTLTPPNLGSIALAPASAAVSVGSLLRFTASDANSGQQLASVTWSSSDDTVATVSNDPSNFGTVHAIASGSVTITACAGTVCGTTTVTAQ